MRYGIQAPGAYVAELEARCVRAEEALRRAEDVVEAARTTLEYPDAVDARQSLEMALGAYDYIAAVVPEENQEAKP